MPDKAQKKSDPSSYYRADPEGYEDSLLLAALKCPELWAVFDKTLCWNTSYRAESNEFSTKLRYNVFRALRQFRHMQADAGSGAEFKAPSPAVLMTMLSVIRVEDPSSLYDTELEPTRDYYNKLLTNTATPDELEVLVRDSYKSWILEKKLEEVQYESKYTDVKGSDLMEKLHKAADEVSARIGSEGEDTLKNFADIIEAEDIVTERLAFSPKLKALNEALGGGVGRKEHIIVVGPTGAGKTVFACQIAANLAATGRKVCYVTTEQPADELVPRIVSCMSASVPEERRIQFRLIKDGVDKRNLSPEQWAQVTDITTKLRDYLGIEEWLGSGLTANDLESTVRKFKKRYGGIDVLILDWIGGALVNGVDPQYKRDYYLDAAKKMKDLAYAYNIATISMAQAVADVGKVRYISDKHIAECKTMHREAVAGFGISALVSNSSETDVSYQDEQYLYAFKSRKAPGLKIELKRQFDYQYFEFNRVHKK